MKKKRKDWDIKSEKNETYFLQIFWPSQIYDDKTKFKDKIWNKAKTIKFGYILGFMKFFDEKKWLIFGIRNFLRKFK